MKEHLPKEISKKKITLLYAIIQGGYWSSFCATYGFATVFLLSRGFTTSQIGISIALANVLAVVCQPTVATIADEAKKISLHSLTILLILSCLDCFSSREISSLRQWLCLCSPIPCHRRFSR